MGSQNFVSCQLNDIPYSITYNNILFKLRGVIGIKLSNTNLSTSSVSHYIAYCKEECVKYWEVYDDLDKKGKTYKKSGKTIIYIEMLLYTI